VHDFSLVEHIRAIRPLTIAFSLSYLALSLRFWFYVPAIGHRRGDHLLHDRRDPVGLNAPAGATSEERENPAGAGLSSWAILGSNQ
jgi:hypothetical protein